MPPIDFAAQTASFTSESFTDGAPSDGAPTATEAAAAAADVQPAQAAEGENPDKSGQADDVGDGEGAGTEGAEGENPDKSGQGTEGGEGGEGSKGKGGKKTVAERIGDLTANWRNAQREADTHKTRAERAEAELAALKSGKAPLTSQPAPATGGDAAPDPSQFDYGELDPKYIAALARYHTTQALNEQRADDDKKRQADAAAAQQREVAQKSDALVKAGVALHDDFDDVVMQGAREGKWELSQHLGELLLDSEFGANIAYELAKNPDEAARVAKLSPVEQAKFLGRQEAKFEAAKSSPAPKAPKAPQALPPPKTPRGNSGSSKVGSDSKDFSAVEAAWRGGQFR